MFGAMPSKEEEGESQLTNEARAETEPVLWLCLARRKKAEGQLTNEARGGGGRQNLFQGYALQGGRRPKAKIRHRQYPKPNYKH